MTHRNLLRNAFALLIALGLFTGSWIPALAEEEVSTAYFPLNFDEQTDLFLGKAGVFMVKSSYHATATVNRYGPDGTLPAEDLEFFDRWLNFGIYDYFGNPYRGLYGFNYVYFNLKYQTRKLWDQGDLSIYRWDFDKKDWVICQTFLVEMKILPHGRLTCIMPRFGTYGLAIEN